MKQYTIEQVYLKYHNLRRKAYLKKSWNREATSYEINLSRIADACHLKLITDSSLNASEKAMLTIMSTGKS